jgi:hypothetical protein
VDDGTADQPREPLRPSGNPSKATSQAGSSFLHRPTAVVTLIAGVAGIASAVVGIVVAFSGNDNSSSEKSSGQDKPDAAVERCTVEHGLERAYEKNEGGTAGTILFRQCSLASGQWGAEADGYAEVAVTSYDGPGKSEAEGLTVADAVRSTCRDVELIYLFDNQGTFVQEEPITLSKGEIRRVEGGSLWFPGSPSEASRFKPGRDQSMIMSNHRYMLDSARCV